MIEERSIFAASCNSPNQMPDQAATNLERMLVAGGIAVVMAYTTLGGRPENQVSFGVRLIIVLIAGVISGIIILIGLIFLIIPGIYLAVRLRLVTPAIMLEDCGPIEALGRSFSLTDGHVWTVFGVTLLLGVLSIVAVGIIAVAIGGIPSTTAELAEFQQTITIAGTIPTVLISPVGVSINAIMFGLYGPD